jgi:hypothetical protein
MRARAHTHSHTHTCTHAPTFIHEHKDQGMTFADKTLTQESKIQTIDKRRAQRTLEGES